LLSTILVANDESEYNIASTNDVRTLEFLNKSLKNQDTAGKKGVGWGWGNNSFEHSLHQSLKVMLPN